jgi:DNA-binding response OmpR family regulator
MTAAKNSILLVEDDGNDVLLLEHAFRKANLSNPIFTVNDGEKAIDYLNGRNEYADRQKFPLPLLMLLDLKLPRKGGLEVLTWLRAQSSALNRLPVVVFTSSRQSRDINRAYDLGANSYLVKPADFERLSEIVKLLDSYWVSLNERPEVR